MATKNEGPKKDNPPSDDIYCTESLISNSKIASYSNMATSWQKVATKNEGSTKINKFMCENCHYSTSEKYNWTRHLKSIAHNSSVRGTTEVTQYTCQKCNNIYKHRSSFFKHTKKCIISDPSNNITTIINAARSTQEFQTFMIEHTKELQNLLLEQNKTIIKQNDTIIELSTKTNITQNTTNIQTNSQTNSQNNNTNSHNKFNINFFLNEKCKDAMNITDFVNSLQLKISDLDTTCDKGYIEGISQIVIRGLKELDIYKRPIHCSDLKRETIFLKNPDGWEKENESKEKLRKMIGTIANKNIDQTADWVKAHPNCKNWNDKNNTRYIKIVSASMGGENKEEDEKFMNKIIHNVAKEVIIQKEENRII